MIKSHDESALRTFLATFASIPDKEWATLRPHLTYCDLQAEEYFVRVGDRGHAIGFVLKGVLRKFYQTEDGKEYIKDFSPEQRLVTPYSALLQDQPSRLAIQALEDTRLLIIPYKQFTALYGRHECWQELGRRIAEGLFIEREQREWELLLFSAKERYELFVKRYPNLLKRVSQYNIASYLGVSAVSLSRLIGKKKPAKKA